eukprot:74461-Lingulodinium_polyedra.AAC.1
MVVMRRRRSGICWRARSLASEAQCQRLCRWGRARLGHAVLRIPRPEVTRCFGFARAGSVSAKA